VDVGLKTQILPAGEAAVAAAARVLAEGGLVAFPTETVYGLGADATNPAAVARIYQAKGRPAFNPLIAHVGDVAAARKIARFDASATALAEAFWPGPLTLVLPARAQPDGTTIAVRAPDHEVALTLLRSLGEPIASSSANPAGRPPPLDADQVIAGMGDRIDLVLDGGPCRIGQPSTILDLSGQLPRILRQGAIPETDLITP
jgi:L-threonylcarbamoyladenylate synthase